MPSKEPNISNLNLPARVRFAPSPTGLTHLGSARTALYNYLIAKQSSGKFVLRIEDTDQKRFDPNAENDLKASLHWLELPWDEGPDIGGPYAPYYQSQRSQIYREQAEKLINTGHAFYCFCTPKELNLVRQEQQKRKEHPRYSGKCRLIDSADAATRVASGETHVIRFKMPKEGSITVKDYLRGDITVENRTLDDKVLLKSDGHALYHLAAMVDDHLMEITHVFRGEEWLPSLPLHAHIYEAFGWDQPQWVHLSVFLKPSGKGKMSKRDTEEMKLSGKSIFVKDFEELGYLPEAIINWIVLMGWSLDDRTEFFTLENLVDSFSLKGLNPSPAAIDFKKLDHFNGLHIRALSTETLANRLLPYFVNAGIQTNIDELMPIVPLIQTRMITLDDGPVLTAFLFKDELSISADSLPGKNMNHAESSKALLESRELLDSLSNFNAESMDVPLRALAEKLELKAGQLFTVIRNAVTGQKISPPLFESMEILGKQKVMARIEQAIGLLQG